MKKVLLYSGGMDSWLIDKIWKPDVKAYINMHTRYSEEEMKRLPKEVRIIDFPLGQYEREDAIVPLRNLYLCMVVCNEIEGDLDICLGATAGDRVLDKSYPFIEKATEILNYLYQPQHWIPEGRKIRINIDFKDKTKRELLAEYLAEQGDIDKAWAETFSCYDPEDGKECWQCKPCFRKFTSFVLNGYIPPQTITEKAINYIEKDILPLIESGVYGRATEEKDILEVLEKYGNSH